MNDNINIIDAWNNTKFRENPQKLINAIIEGRQRTSLENLARRYRRFSIFALIFVFYGPFTILSDIFPDTSGAWLLAIGMSIFFATASVMDYWLYSGIKSIDCATMTVQEVVHKAMFYRKRHLQFIAILVPGCLTIIGCMAYMGSGNKYFIYGIVFGFILGLSIGLTKLMQFMSDYKKIFGNL